MKSLPSDRHRQMAFTLIEVILAIALIALASTLVFFSFTNLTRGLDRVPMEDLARQAVREVRYAALSGKEAAFLSWDNQQAEFVITGGAASDALEAIPTLRDPRETELQVVFEVLQPRLGIDLREPPETLRPVDLITVSPEGISPPFRIRWTEFGEESTLRFDPFSNLVIEEE